MQDKMEHGMTFLKEQHMIELLALHDYIARRDEDCTQDDPDYSEHTTTSYQGSTMQESRGHEHQPFKTVPNPLINRTMKVNLKGFQPFTSEVMSTQLPRRWKWPNLEKYAGTSDPETNVKAYMTQANFFSKNMVVHCCSTPLWWE